MPCQHSPEISPDKAQQRRPRPRALRAAGLLLLVVVVSLAFAGYMRTDMQLQWESIAALCGF